MGLFVREIWAEIKPSYPIKLKTSSANDENNIDESKDAGYKDLGFGAAAGAGAQVSSKVSIGLQLGGESSRSALGPTYSVEPMFYVRLRAGMTNDVNEILDIGLGYWKQYASNGKYSFSGAQIRVSEGYLLGEDDKKTRYLLSGGVNLRLNTGETGDIPTSFRHEILECFGYVSVGIRLSNGKPQENKEAANSQ